MGAKTMTARKVPVKKLKTAKKTVPPRGVKKVAGGGRWGKIDEAILSMSNSIAESNARLDARVAETDARIAETDARIEAGFAKTDARIAETDARIAETDARLEKAIASMDKTTRDLAKSVREVRDGIEDVKLELRRTTQDLSDSLDRTTQELRRTTQDLAKSVREVSDNIGGVNRSIGRVVEMVVLPGLMEAMNTSCGYQFDNLSSDRIFKDNGQQYAEVDLFLENGDSVMAVEAKTRVKRGELNDFVEKLETLRKHENKAGLVGKTIYAAVAGITFDTNAETFAKEKGMYLVKINQNDDRIHIESPTGEVGKW